QSAADAVPEAFAGRRPTGGGPRLEAGADRLRLHPSVGTGSGAGPVASQMWGPGPDLLAAGAALVTSPPQQLLVLLLAHALTALLDQGTHGGGHSRRPGVTNPNRWSRW